MGSMTKPPWSMTQTLLLLTSTQRKLQAEERLYDSNSLLKAIQLQHIARTLNDHLHNGQPDQWRHVFQSSEQQCYRPETWSDGMQDDSRGSLAGLYEAARPGAGEPVVVEVEEIEDDNSSLDTSASPPPFNSFDYSDTTTHIHEVEAFDDEEADPLDLEAYAMDLESMPSLSRQESHSSIPSLYHSDNDSEEEDSEDMLLNNAVHRLLSMQQPQASHPASYLFDKDSSHLTGHPAHISTSA